MPSFAGRHRKTLRRTLIVGVPALALLIAGSLLAAHYWPYRYSNVRTMLQQLLASKITVSSYHRIYFPLPVFVATALTLRRDSAPGLPPFGSAEKVTMQSNWSDLLLFRHRIHLVAIEGLHVVIPPEGSKENREDFPPGSSADFAGPQIAVQTFVVHRGVLDIMRTNGSRYTYPVHRLVMHNVQQGSTASFDMNMQYENPTGQLHASGHFGPLNAKNLGKTPISGAFTFTRVQLNQIGELHGTLTSSGHFSGPLAAVEVHATASTPDFAVSDGRPASVRGSVQCTINGLNGNIILQSIELRRGQSTIQASGSVTGPADKPKATDIDLAVFKGRVQDLLHPFLHRPPPAVGVVSLKAHAHLAPQSDDTAFLKRLTVQGGFYLPEERLTDRKTEKTLTSFSRRAQGNDSHKDNSAHNSANPSAEVLSSLVGKVTIQNGIVSTRRLIFTMPGASADLHGVYHLHSGKVHLLGTLTMQSDISHAATGFKAFLLKALAPFFKKRHAGAVVPIAVTGVPGHYHVSQNILHNK